MKTIEETCIHEVLYKIGEQEDGKGGYFSIGNCRECDSTITIDGKYDLVIRDLYILKEKI